MELFAKLQEADSVMMLGGGAGAVVALVMPDAFSWMFLLLAVSNLADWVLGRHAARARDEYDRTKSRNGLYSKASQMVVLLILRTLEFVLTLMGLPSTLGLASAAIALALIVEDMESIERHGIALGGGPIPGLSGALGKLRALTGSDRREGPRRPPVVPHSKDQRL